MRSPITIKTLFQGNFCHGDPPSTSRPGAAYGQSAMPAAAAVPFAGLRRWMDRTAPVQRSAPVAVPPAATDGRTAFLQAYQAASVRPLDAEKARDAIKLRKFAEARYRKNVFSRVTHKLPLVGPTRFQRALIESMEVDVLIDHIRRGTIRSDRSTLTDVAKHHLVAALNFDQAAYARGVRKMAVWEGVHSTAARGITFAASSVAFGVAPVLAAAGNALAAGFAKALRIASHHVPTALVNPVVTGFLRCDTDVRKSSNNGGSSRLAKNIDGAPSLRKIRTELAAQESALQALLRDRRTPGNVTYAADGTMVLRPAFRDALCAGAMQTFGALDACKTRYGAVKAQTWSKGYGMGVNAVAGAAQVAGIAFPPAIPVSLGIQGLCIPLQLGAGYLDLHTGQAYNFRATLKYGDLLTDAGRHVPADQLQAAHIDLERLRHVFQSAEAQKIELIREIYTDELAELHRQRDRIDVRLARLGASTDRASLRERSRLLGQHRDLDQALRARHREAQRFESFDAAAWAALPPDCTIGRCLDDRAFLVKRAQIARRRKPGEVAAQVWQRYKQTYGSGLMSAGIAMPAADIGLHVDAGHGGGHSHVTVTPTSGAGAACDVAAGIGAATFAAATGIVRVDKARDKQALARIIAARDADGRRDALAKAWTMPGDRKGKAIDLSHTGAFDRTLHTRQQRIWRFIKTVPSGFFALERGVYQAMRIRRVRQRAKATLAATVAVLQEGHPPQTSGTTAAMSTAGMPVAALKATFLAMPEVRRCLDRLVADRRSAMR